MKYQVVILSLAASFSTVLHAESSVRLSSGLSYINQQNLQSTRVAGASGTVSRARTGLQLDGSWQWMQFNPRGGYSVSGDAGLNRGLDGARNIRSLSLGGNWMHAINPNWLARIGLRISDYRDDNQPAYSNRSGGGEFTVGWFGEQGAGLDLKSSWQREDYDDDPVDPYQATRISLGGRYYFPHQRNAPYWSMGVEFSFFDADQSSYSYDAYLLTAGYNGWRWRQLEGDIQLLWRNNQYENTVASASAMDHQQHMSMGGIHPAMSGNSQSESQQDSYLSTNLNLRYPMGKQWRLVSNLGAGQYRSNLADDRPLLSLYLGAVIDY